MKGSVLTTQTWVLLIGAALLVTLGALNFAERLTTLPPPHDGVDWTETGPGVITAGGVVAGSAANHAGILPGDRLIAVSFDEIRFEEISSALDVQIYLEQAGVGGHLYYLIERPSFPPETRFYYADLYNLSTVPNWTAHHLYLNFVGLVYLLVGFFVLFKQTGRAPFVVHFATLCLTAFVFHFYKPIASYEDLDLAVKFLDDAALVLFAPLFFHFCLLYPVHRYVLAEHRWVGALIYVPAVLLLLLTALVCFAPSSWINLSGEFVGWLYTAQFAQTVLALVAGAGVLINRLLRSEAAVVRQQLKWVVWGAVLAIVPFTLLCAVGYVLGNDVLLSNVTTATNTSAAERWVIDAAILPLVLIPLTFGNSVVRYRLMDVDMVVRRVAVYALTTLTIALMIGFVVYVAGLYAFGGEQQVGPGVITPRVIIAVIAMAAIVILAAPIKNFLQEQIDRLFYGERYDLRNGLLDFGRTISATTALDPLLDALTGRLQQVLGVERIAIFIEDRRASGGYRVARHTGLSSEVVAHAVPPDFRRMIQTRSAETGIVRADDFDSAAGEAAGGNLRRRVLHYYVPCVIRERMIAVIGLGRSVDGALLSSEDVGILHTVAGYVAVAIENSLLYQEQHERAAELEILKEFNESIVESVNVGLLAVDLDGRITRCNSALEEMLGVHRDAAVGRHVEEFFAEDFAETLRQALGNNGWHLTELRHIYKIHTATSQGRALVLNIALAPLQHANNLPAANAQAAGALVVLEDTTARTRLEEQLQQREKLSSIGLLAAGVAHEINTPLTGVSSYTQMLLGMIPVTDPKHALLQKVHRQTDRATGIVNNLLNFSRTGGATEFAETDVNRVIDDTMQLLEPQLRRGVPVEIVRCYDPNLPMAFANAGKLQQIFTNLVLNARDAIPEGGQVTLHTQAVEETVVIEIIDTGVGIAPENIVRIYDPFFTTKGVGRGTGLGLAVTYGIVQEHSGQISVESVPGKGTTFRITLPTAQARTARLRAAGD